jgi:hypothetical protein
MASRNLLILVGIISLVSFCDGTTEFFWQPWALVEVHVHANHRPTAVGILASS